MQLFVISADTIFITTSWTRLHTCFQKEAKLRIVSITFLELGEPRREDFLLQETVIETLADMPEVNIYN